MPEYTGKDMAVPDFKKLTEDMGELHEKAVLDAVRAVADEAPDRVQEAIDALCEGMLIVGEYFDTSEYFVGDLIYAGEIFSECFDLLKSLYPTSKALSGHPGKVVLATVEGDFHDIGKNIVRVTMEAKGLTVIDLGVNVPPSVIVKTALEEHASVVALSAVLTSAIDAMAQTIALFKKEGCRDKVSIIVGGACVNEPTALRIGADAYGDSPEDTARFCLAACS